MSDFLFGIPLYWGVIIAVTGYVIMIIWTWFRPKEFIMDGAPDRKRWRDLRIWATLTMAVQIAIYLLYGT